MRNDQTVAAKFSGFPPCRHCKQELEMLAKKFAARAKDEKFSNYDWRSDDPYVICSCGNYEPLDCSLEKSYVRRRLYDNPDTE